MMHHEDNEDMPKALAEGARRSYKQEWKMALSEAAVDTSTAIDRLVRERSSEALRHLQNQWIKSRVLLDAAQTEQDPQPPMAGAPEAARLAA